MKHALQVLIFAAACGAGAAYAAVEAHDAVASGVDARTDTVALNFPKITYNVITLASSSMASATTA